MCQTSYTLDYKTSTQVAAEENGGGGDGFGRGDGYCGDWQQVRRRVRRLATRDNKLTIFPAAIFLVSLL